MALTLADAGPGDRRGRATPASRCRSASTGGSPPDFAAAAPAARRRRDRHAAADALADPRPGARQPRRASRRGRSSRETLIHDFDSAAAGSTPAPSAVEVYATADALVAPEFKDGGPARHRGRRDHASTTAPSRRRRGVLLRRLRLRRPRRGVRLGRHGDRPATGRAAVHGLLRRRRAAGRRPCAATSSCSATPTPPSSPSSPTPCARAARPPVTGEDARARARHRAGLHRVRPRPTRPVAIAEARPVSVHAWPCRAEMVFVDLPFVERVRRIARRRASRSRSGTGPSKDIDALAATGAHVLVDDRLRRRHLTDPDGAEDLLRTAGESLAASPSARLPAPQRARHRPRRPRAAGRARRRRHRRHVAGGRRRP